MDTGDFAVFATVQLTIITLIGVGRLSVYGPALSSQRHHGRSRIPVRWVLPVSIALTAASAPLVAWVLTETTSLRAWEVAFVSLAPVVVYGQDGLRYVRMSESQIGAVLFSDLAWLCITLPLVAVFGSSLISASLAWIAGAAFGFVILIFRSASDLPATRFVSSWTLGKWGLLDSSLAAFVVAGPTFVTSFYDQSLVAAYRVTQSAVSPMNLINGVLVMSFGLGAWQLGLPDAREKLALAVKRATSALVALAAMLASLGVGSALLFAQMSLGDSWQPWLIVAVATMAGGWMSARQAASQALGMQRVGAITRLVSAAYACAIILAASSTTVVGDPIGITLAGATAISLVGSQIAYRRGLAQI
ncbi:MAG: hypothetical protein Q8R60_11210 [Mycobacteriales bacterium]|nr:hypothetical protein [Mycobacteriales bacterium]